MREREEDTMSITSSWNYRNATSGVTHELPSVDYSQFSELERGSRQELWITNTTSPVDSPETVRFAIQNVNDIYAGSEILPSYRATSKAGRQLLIQLNDVLRLTDSADPTYHADLPFSGHIVLRFPTNESTTALALQVFYERLVRMAYATGVADDTRLEALMRGALKPSNLG